MLILALGGAPVLGSSRPSHAQPKRHKGEPTPEEARQTEARAHYDKGILHYNLGEFDPAVEEFKQAYSLSNAPGLLFNIAQVYRAKEDYKNALYFYRTYLRLQPEAPNRADVEARIAELERLERQKAERERSTEPVAPSLAPRPEEAAPTTGIPGTGALNERRLDPETAAAERRSAHKQKLIGLITAGAGVALLGTGVYFGLKASSAADDISALSDKGIPWSPAYADKYSEGDSASTIATILYVAGGAAIVTGGVLYYLGWRKDTDARLSVSVVPLPHAPSMVVSCRF